MMILIIIALVIWVISLYFKLMNRDTKYLGDTSSFKRRLQKKDKDIKKLEKELIYWKNRENYEEYLKD